MTSEGGNLWWQTAIFVPNFWWSMIRSSRTFQLYFTTTKKAKGKKDLEFSESLSEFSFHKSGFFSFQAWKPSNSISIIDTCTRNLDIPTFLKTLWASFSTLFPYWSFHHFHVFTWHGSQKISLLSDWVRACALYLLPLLHASMPLKKKSKLLFIGTKIKI